MHATTHRVRGTLGRGGTAPSRSDLVRPGRRGRRPERQPRSLSGDAFDRAYVQAQERVHKQLRFVQRTYLSSGDNNNLRDIARLADTVINEHLTLLRS